ncbi:MAG TPA: carboxypeptidase-like regulatory domain-containing protein [Bryobacteraceae bacterium]|nr:carboxypeptidase-like regulatory domain-containing protein [Bryobacteraceae bacterium]
MAGLIFLLLCSVPLAMQIETGSIEGIVSNDFGPVPNASIDAMNAMTGAPAHVQSDRAGAYILKDLHAGRYSLWVQAPGNDYLWIREVPVERGQITHHDIHLKLARAIPTGL